MPDLIAHSQDGVGHWRRRLESGHSVVIGRDCGVWSVMWDPHISRQHIRVRWDGERLRVEQLPDAGNPVFLRGQPNADFSVGVQDFFVIGSTTFRIVDNPTRPSRNRPRPATEQTIRPEDLHAAQFRHAASRVDVLSRVPDLVQASGSDSELCNRMVALLLDGIPQARAAGIIQVGSGGAQATELPVLHWDHRRLSDVEFHPSARLVERARETGETVLHLWQDSSDTECTHSATADWAFCLPLAEPYDHWMLYVEGQTNPSPGTHQDPSGGSLDSFQRDDMKFAELVAHTAAQIGSSREWERRHARLRPFFSGGVLDAIEIGETGWKPRECRVSVLFCDLRGFSKSSQEAAHDLLAFLERISEILGVVTGEILQHQGVIGDFHGDAAMGFWGWPLPQYRLADVCQAALNIQDQLAQFSEEDVRAGIGLASGPAVAGPIGTRDQVKVTVFGPVVNRAARLEALTKQLQGSILLDETTARLARDHLTNDTARVRRLARVHIPSLASTEQVFQLLPPIHSDNSLSDEDLGHYERALASFEQGDWEAAFVQLHQISPSDRAKDFLTAYVARHHRQAPPDWQGIVELDRVS